jgi:S1-C subfamily serine protease
MFIGKDQFVHGIPKYKDQLASTLNNLAQTEMRHLDFSDVTIVSKLQERIGALTVHRRALQDIVMSIEKNVTTVVTHWLMVLDGMEPDEGNMTPLEIANYHLTAGRANKAREILESLSAGEDGLTKEAFHLLLKCYVALGLQDAYRDAHRRYGGLFEMVYPDFNRLNAYLKVVEGSIFMIRGTSNQRGISGSGFCVAPNLIVTNRHVVEGMPRQQIKIIGKDRAFGVEQVELDPFNDLAVLRMSETVEPLKLGEFGFVEPGERVFAIGFPAPSSDIHSENIYISTGVVNSIRRVDVSTERVIFTDAKIGSGMSGGPLMNALGEVVGILAFVRYDMSADRNGRVFVQDQPTALPIHLVRKYVMSTR